MSEDGDEVRIGSEDSIEGDNGGFNGGEYAEYSSPQLEGGSLSCAARDWHLIPPDVASKFGADTKALDLSYNLLKYSYISLLFS